MKVTGASNRDLAECAGFDRSNISRIRSGAKPLKKGSVTSRRLVYAIYRFADQNNTLEALCKLIRADGNASAEIIQDKIFLWLFEGEADADEHIASSVRQMRVFRVFSERLDAAMSLSGLSNIRLSRMLHADPSLISRYRSGVRYPKSNSALAENLSNILLQRIIRCEKKDDLAGLMHISPEELDEESFSAWLYNETPPQDESIQAAESLFDIFDSYPSHTRHLTQTDKAVSPELLNDQKEHYLGTEGLRAAVLRFLGTALKENAEILYLYSDEDQSWMTSDPEFLMQWSSLMQACVANGTKINIIHNIDRDLNEMNAAIKSWLPLYMSGMIESYYCRKALNPRFSHTLFLFPGKACIYGFHVKGTEGSGIYHYDTEHTDRLSAEYISLTERSDPLIKSVSAEYFTRSEKLTVIQGVLSVATMPEILVSSFHCEKLKEYWRSSSRALLEQLESGTVIECIPLADDEVLFKKQLSVERIAGIENLFYTPEQYAIHIDNIIRLTELFPGYIFCPLSEAPFPNTKLKIAPEYSKITHSSRPDFSFGFTHPMMCRAFSAYAELLISQNRTDRNSLRHMLEGRYL